MFAFIKSDSFKSTAKKAAKITGYVAAGLGVIAGGFVLVKKYGSSTIDAVADVASEQVVGG